MNSPARPHIWIVGASSGIGRALAHAYAKQGAQLSLSARREHELAALIKELEGEGHQAYPLDVAKPDQIDIVTGVIRAQHTTIDKIIVMAAIYEPQAIVQMSSQALRRMIDINLLGTLEITRAVLPWLRAQGRGQLALCGSVAGYRGLPNGQPYSATKAAIQNFAETLWLEEAPHGLDVRLMSPGFVETPMTAKNTFSMPMMISPEQAAAAIVEGLNGKAFEVHFPKRFTRMMKLLRCLPNALYFKVAGKLKA